MSSSGLEIRFLQIAIAQIVYKLFLQVYTNDFYKAWKETISFSSTI